MTDREQYEAKRAKVIAAMHRTDGSYQALSTAALAALDIRPPKEPTLGERVAGKMPSRVYLEISRDELISAIDDAVAADAGKGER